MNTPDANPSPPSDSARQAAASGFRDAIAVPALIVLTGMMGFGSLAADSGISLWGSLAASAGIWGLPGQVAMAEFYAAGAGALAVAVAVSLANARFMPMTMSLFPLMRGGFKNRLHPYALVQMISVNSWAACNNAFPSIPHNHRVHYYTTFALTILVIGQAGTALGYFAVAALPRAVTLGLIFLNPCYFALLFAGTRVRANAVALVLGAVAGPPVFALIPEWSLLITGLAAGTAAFVIAPSVSRPGSDGRAP